MKAIIIAAMLSPLSTPLSMLNENLAVLTSMYRDCSQGEYGIGDSCDRILDDRVFERLNAVNTQLKTPNWYLSLPVNERKQITAKVDELKSLTVQIEERRQRNIEASLSAMQ